jgi:hypothetical protein
MTVRPEIQGVSIVLLGDFNPKIFQPAWFAAQGLIGTLESEEAEANVEIIHPDVTIFRLDWLTLQVTRERFLASTAQEAYVEVLRDLVFGTFTLLRHTPAGVMGINLDMHFRMRSEEEWHAFGDRLAPKEQWKGVLEKPGMRRLDMEGARPDGLRGYIRVRVEPSPRIHPGVYFSVNDHYTVENPAAVVGCDEIIDILGRHWGESIKRSENIISSLQRDTTGAPG